MGKICLLHRSYLIEEKKTQIGGFCLAEYMDTYETSLSIFVQTIVGEFVFHEDLPVMPAGL